MNKKSFKEYFCAKVGIEKKSHSRGFLSAVYTTFKNESGGDPRLQPSGMTPLFNHGGFTLIELLVVVLIIGILAAVALPQYNKAVKRAQGREVYVAIDALDKALHSYYLENGNYNSLGSYMNLDWEKLNISMPELKNFTYSVGSLEPNYTDIYIRGGGDAKITMRWTKGKLDFAGCSGNDCGLYFDCPEYLQMTSIQEAAGWQCNLYGGLVEVH